MSTTDQPRDHDTVRENRIERSSQESGARTPDPDRQYETYDPSLERERMAHDQSVGRERTSDDPSPDRELQKVRETKPSLLTTEFWLTAGGIAALVVLYLVEDDPTLDLFRACLLGTILVTAYVVSRGFAKSGSRTQRMATDAPRRWS